MKTSPLSASRADAPKSAQDGQADGQDRGEGIRHSSGHAQARREARREAEREAGNWLHPSLRRHQGAGGQVPRGVRWADAITGFVGSWRFLWLQSVVVVGWIALNRVGWGGRFDPYPFILLNLAFSTQAACAAPLILMAGNAAAARDREMWEGLDASQRALEKIEALETQVRRLAEQNTIMLRQSQELLALLAAQNEAD